MNRAMMLGATAAVAFFAGRGVEAASFSSADTPYHNLSAGGWGMDDSRVSLWPLFYSDSTSTSLLWPLFSKSDDYLGLCPLYSQRGRAGVDAFSVLWPLCQQDFTAGRGWLFPCFWSSDSFTLFPLLWTDSDDVTLFPLAGRHVNGRDSTFWAGLGLAGFCRSGDALTESWLFPAYYASNDSFWSLPYFNIGGADHDTEGLLGGLVGWTRGGGVDSYWALPFFLKTESWLHTPLFSYSPEREGRFFSLPLLSTVEHDRMTFLLGLAGRRFDTGWIFPLYYREGSDFISLPYTRFNRVWLAALGLAGGADGSHWCLPLYVKTPDWFHTPLLSWSLDETKSFFSLPLLSWAEQGEVTLLMGLAGVRPDCHWIVPLYYSGTDWFVSLPYTQSEKGWIAGFGLAGSWNSADWLLPLYVRDDDCFLTLLYGQARRRDGGTLGVLPWALSGASWDSAGGLKAWRALLFLAGRDEGRDGSFTEWVAPLYFRSGRNFYSLPYCSYDDEGTETTLWASLLVGTHSGAKNGFWAFPLFGTEETARFEEVRRRLDALTLPDDLAYVPYKLPGGGKKPVEVRRPAVGRDTVSKSFTSLFVCREEKVSDAGSGKMREWYHVRDTTSWFTPFLWRADEMREVIFDVGTRKRRGERISGNAHVLGFVYRHEEREDTTDGTRSSESSVLWRMWKRTERDGAVSTDVFPGITSDTRKDGSSRFSFLWKVYNRETDANGESHLDLFFIPVR